VIDFGRHDGQSQRPALINFSQRLAIIGGTSPRNVVFLTCDADPTSRRLDLDDDLITENTRGAYPLDCVMPPISRLTPDQAIYHFISGYTSKIAGTEIGLGTEPEITFSTCFGGPFMVHRPYAYAEMLKARLLKYGAVCWLVNTGWTGGSFGVGKRISIQHTRKLLNAALSGKLNKVAFRADPVFGFEVPTECEGVPAQILNPASTWPSQEEYDRKYQALREFQAHDRGLPRGRRGGRPQKSAGAARLRQVGQTIALRGLPTPPRPALVTRPASQGSIGARDSRISQIRFQPPGRRIKKCATNSRR
jgi:hypothetical protein